MRRYGWVAGALVIVVVLIIIEMSIISNVSGYEVKEKVVFAAGDIRSNTVITGEMLEIREVGADAVHRDALRSIDDAVGLTAAESIYKGEQIIKARLTDEPADTVETLDKSNRLFCLEPKSDQANAWQLEKDQYVDLIYVPNYGQQDNMPPEAAGVVAVPPMENGVRMLRSVRIAGLVDEDGNLAGTDASFELPQYILLEVTPEQAVFLAFAKSNGRIELSGIPE
jgi:Flp pilus assembly protein CpaB